MQSSTLLGRIFFATAVVASGIQQLIRADFVRLVPNLPAWMPWPGAWAVAVGALLVVIGAAWLTGFHVRRAALALGALLLATFVVQRVPEILARPGTGFVWTNPSKVLALLGGALVLGATARPAATTRDWLQPLVPAGPALFGVFLVICGVQHFVYADFVDTLVPGWLPGTRGWTLFTGVCLQAGGLGVLLPPTRRWAGWASGVMIFLWVLLLHLPRAIALSRDPGETSAVFEALGMSGIALLIAGLPRNAGCQDRLAPAAAGTSAPAT